MKQLFFGLSALSLLLSACTPQPVAIEYGAEACIYCQMTIVDPKQGAEVVSDKGRVYKFDAIECLVNYLEQHSEQPVALTLVNDYWNPGAFLSADTAFFLISRNVPSPMGAFLSACGSKETADAWLAEKGGTLYTYAELRALHQRSGTWVNE
ncbi:MAG: nitrous oxide reductase accessory protein NosL [Haliscomenobacter sp.]